MKELMAMIIRDGKELLRTVKSILEKEFTKTPVTINGLRVSRYVKRLSDDSGADIEVSKFTPANNEETDKEGSSYLRIKKPLSRRELAQALKEILGWN
jgi:hypothetical protein